MKSRANYLAFGTPNFSEEEIEAVTRTLRSGWVGMGPETLSFEKELESYTGARKVVAVNSCTSALFLSLRAIGIGPGDEVIVPSLTWCSTANAVLYLGATPIICDVELDSMSASAATISAELTSRTKAVIPVHYGGLASDISALRRALPPNISIVEDAAHALGARYSDETLVGSSGNLTCYSFYANKNLSTGDGGAVAVNDAELAEKVRIASQQGLHSDSWKRFSDPMAALTPSITELGYKMNFTDLQAAIGRIQLRRQSEFFERRRRIVDIYLNRLSSGNSAIRFQKEIDSTHHARHLFVVRLPLSEMKIGRNELLLELRSRNVGASIHYAPLHTLPLYKPYIRSQLPNVEKLAHEIMTLPIGPNIADDDGEYVADQLLELLNKTRKC